MKINRKLDKNLGKMMVCTITGFEGIATAKIEYISGCFQYCIKPKVGDDGKMPEGQYIDVEQLSLKANKKVKIASSPTGGDNRMDAPKG